TFDKHDWYLNKNKEHGDGESSEMLQINLGMEEFDAYLSTIERRKDEPPPDEVDKDLPKIFDKKAREGKFKIEDWELWWDMRHGLKGMHDKSDSLWK
ncbi:hypothetical protein KI387_044547, partial [Taxus chinensis]